jgi:hypothetical protein
MHRPKAALSLLGTAFLLLTVPAVATEIPDESARVQPALSVGREPLDVPRVESRVTIDGVLDEEVWAIALSIPVNTEVQPGENIPAPVDMEVLLAYGPEKVYVGFRAHDPEPERIRARYSDRDNIFDDDWVAILFDTFNDARRSFLFFSNPLGVQADTVETATGGGDSSWDAIWDSAGQITPTGYTVEMAIPFSSLRFQGGAQSQIWGLDAIRSYPRGVRHHIGAFPRDRGNNCYLCQALKISGFAGADPGRNLELDPTLVSTYGEARDDFPDGEFTKRTSDLDAGLTARWSVTPNLTLNGTINPDFSQVEADAAELDINTQFALFYPEKRPFFMEGADFFELPIGVVYTRTMADPEWGLKLSGKVGKGAIGFFSVEDSLTNLLFPGSQRSRATSLAERNQASAFRYRHDVGKSSTVGVIATDREGTDYYNRLLGLDAVLRFTQEDTLYLNLFSSRSRYGAETARTFDQPSGEFSGNAFDLMFNHETRKTEHYIHFQDFDDDFRADMGFVPQVGFRFLDLGTLRSWFHDDPGHWFNKIKAWVGYERTEDSAGNSLRSVGGTFIHYDGPRQSRGLAILYLGTQSFKGIEYGHDTLDAQAYVQVTDDIELGARVFYGDAIDFGGERPATRYRLTPMLELFGGRHLQVELDHTYERLWVDDGRLYEAHLSDLRAIYQVNRRTLLRLVLQHSDFDFSEELYSPPRRPKSRDLLSQILFSYKINPQTALYLGYSDNYLGTPASLRQVDRTLFLKIGYAWVM